MPFTTYSKNLMLAALPNTVYLALHTATPSTGSPNEVTGGSPAYARVSATIANASGGVRTMNPGTYQLNVPASTTVTHVGIWTASSSGELLEYYDIVNEAFAAQGKAEITTLTLTLADGSG